MSDESKSNRVVVTMVGSVPLAIEVDTHAIIEENFSGVEMVDSGPGLTDRLGDLTALITRTAAVLTETIGSMADSVRPTKVEGEFSIAFSAEAGFWYIAKGSASGAIKVKLEWPVPSKSPSS